MYTKDDEKKFSIKWTDDICKPSDVRCTKLTRYVAIQEDHERLEVNEAGTWSQLFAAHRDLVPGPSSPSGHSNCYASVPYRFPTAIQLQGLEAISDALVGRVRWDNPTVIEELDILFGPHEKKAQQFISDWRLKATQIALDTIVNKNLEKFCDNLQGSGNACLNCSCDKKHCCDFPKTMVDQVLKLQCAYIKWTTTTNTIIKNTHKVSAVAFAQAINKELKTILANMSKETPSVNDKSDLTALNSKVVKALQQTSGILKEIQEIQEINFIAVFNIKNTLTKSLIFSIFNYTVSLQTYLCIVRFFVWGSTQAATAIGSLGIRRPIEWRSNPVDDRFLDVKPIGKGSQMNAVIVYTRGHARHRPCAACAKGNGPFLQCVVAESTSGLVVGKGACASCIWSNSPHACSLRSGVTGSQSSPLQEVLGTPSRVPPGRKAKLVAAPGPDREASQSSSAPERVSLKPYPHLQGYIFAYQPNGLTMKSAIEEPCIWDDEKKSCVDCLERQTRTCRDVPESAVDVIHKLLYLREEYHSFDAADPCRPYHVKNMSILASSAIDGSPSKHRRFSSPRPTKSVDLVSDSESLKDGPSNFLRPPTPVRAVLSSI
ncbi:uncharacterized protein CIMG_03742 [Coccidioides immitis RS]|uniref:Uncharacterized protein n=1 Tax=Coccidioides immitis (strain RS) TaxID=246410 RepID=A0A0E1RWU6_COCIM|nr:uncharacterized protein CIMG_03742 [Coccidioides immitis RS]EAS32718.2 hypothetical protein CIMG_03742 [Coccidioides immitis RS]